MSDGDDSDDAAHLLGRCENNFLKYGATAATPANSLGDIGDLGEDMSEMTPGSLNASGARASVLDPARTSGALLHEDNPQLSKLRENNSGAKTVHEDDGIPSGLPRVISVQSFLDKPEEEGNYRTGPHLPTHIDGRNFRTEMLDFSQDDMSSFNRLGTSAGRKALVRSRVRQLTFISALGGFLFGYDTGVISGALLPLRRSFNLKPSEEEVVVTAAILAAFVSSLVGGSLNQAFGRRSSAIFAALLFTAGSIILAFSWSYSVLVIGRAVVGVGIGVASLTTPVYIAEMAPPSERGRLVTINALLVCIGQFGAGMIDGIFGQLLPEGGSWRYMLGLAALPSLTMGLGFLSLPESPRWLVMKGRIREALKVLKEVRDTDQAANDELFEIIDASNLFDENRRMEGEETVLQVWGSGSGSRVKSRNAGTSPAGLFRRITAMFKHAPSRRALGLGCGLMALQQFR